MQKVMSLDEYYVLVKAAKKENSAKASNCFLFPNAIKRFIDLGRFYYEKQDGGILFYSDEEVYYEAYYYHNPEVAVRIEKKDKPVVISNIHTGAPLNDRLRSMEQRLKEAGFLLADTMRQTQGDAQKNLSKIERLCKYARRELERDGFTLSPLSEKWFPAVRALLDNTPELPFYLSPYYTTEELKQLCEDGFIVGIISADGELCAAQHFFLEGKTLFGWEAVKENYKNLYGMALVMSEHILGIAVERGYNVSGWIDLANEPSIQYHLKKGNIFTDRYMDHWVLTNH